MITLAIALADKWNQRMTGMAYLIAMIADAYWLSTAFGALK